MTRPAPAPRHGRLSVRLKLTLSYAGLVVVAGIAMFAVGLLLLRFVPEGAIFADSGAWAPNRSNLMDVFVRYAWWATAGLVVFGLVGGWVLAGVVLRPLGRITEVTRRVRDGMLDERIALPGPRDEFTELADVFDEMVTRVQRVIDTERRFAANASHELRTPTAIIRTMVEVAQADPDHRDIDTVLARIGATNDRAADIIESLLVLSRVEHGVALSFAPVDLAAVAADAFDDIHVDADARGISLDRSGESAVIAGDRRLVERLVGNLARNAVTHNHEGGVVRVSTRMTSGGGELSVTNSGPILAPAHLATLTEPFVRGGGRVRRGGMDGAGLGLAIVASIVRAHGGVLDLAAPAAGGLQVRVTLPAHPAR
ncbi:sensor histidine kinase [Microbacterium gorillae]|uniref:sensor histidine kinase n=1 Tax=Microbacterium gorillae TaxID=1231063 RepID=UPI000AB89A4C|nr:HAMP domain-containing sensor histidine kinase [Microbacterium gorillae]